MRLFLALIVFTTSSLFATDDQDARVGENLVEVARRDFEKENFAGAHATLDRFEKSKGPTGLDQKREQDFQSRDDRLVRTPALRPWLDQKETAALALPVGND